MQPITTFDSTKEALSDMLQSIKTGKTQLPDFQRGWIWDDEHIKSLGSPTKTSIIRECQSLSLTANKLPKNPLK